MVETRYNSGRSDGAIPEVGRREPGPGFARQVTPGRASAPAHRDRIPSLRQLAALVVNGMLRLPRNYHRGMFLDILA